MDRRDFVKAALPLVAAGAVIGKEACGAPVSGVPDGRVPPGHPFETMEPLLLKKPSYDPVAVLEAMRERGLYYSIDFSPRTDYRLSATAFFKKLDYPNAIVYDEQFVPDFPSAVRWLHRQAAAADPEFAEKWPIEAE